MKAKIFKAVLTAMTLAVTCNAANAAQMNNMTETNETPVCMVASTTEYTVSPSASTVNGTLLVDASTTERVKPRAIDRYTYRFYADEEVLIWVKGDGDTDLDLYVYDENGNLIDSDTDEIDICFCKFTPRWTGKFTIKVKNLGDVFNEYRIRFVQ